MIVKVHQLDKLPAPLTQADLALLVPGAVVERTFNTRWDLNNHLVAKPDTEPHMWTRHVIKSVQPEGARPGFLELKFTDGDEQVVCAGSANVRIISSPVIDLQNVDSDHQLTEDEVQSFKPGDLVAHTTQQTLAYGCVAADVGAVFTAARIVSVAGPSVTKRLFLDDGAICFVTPGDSHVQLIPADDVKKYDPAQQLDRLLHSIHQWLEQHLAGQASRSDAVMLLARLKKLLPE